MKEGEVLEQDTNVIQTNLQTKLKQDIGHASFGNQEKV